jgi:hypothetical protein
MPVAQGFGIAMRPALPGHVGNVEPLRPIRVLVSSRDRRFLAAAAFFLTRRRLCVEATTDSKELVRAVEETRADVVVVDATESVSAAARTAGAIEGRHPRTRVILLLDRPDELCAAPRTLPKWGALERLADAVVHAYGTPSA